MREGLSRLFYFLYFFGSSHRAFFHGERARVVPPIQLLLYFALFGYFFSVGNSIRPRATCRSLFLLFSTRVYVRPLYDEKCFLAAMALHEGEKEVL